MMMKVYAALITEKLNLLNNSVSVRVSCSTCLNAVVQHLHRPTIVLLLVYCSADDTLLEVSP